MIRALAVLSLLVPAMLSAQERSTASRVLPYIVPVVAFAGGYVDVDRGGYRDTWYTIDKPAHAAMGSVCVLGLRVAHATLRESLVSCALGALAWEAGTRARGGFWSSRDIYAGGIGITVAVGWEWTWR